MILLKDIKTESQVKQLLKNELHIQVKLLLKSP